MLVVGLTGGIGSGKSTVSDLFAQHGVPIIDADVIARELAAPQQPAYQDIVTTFGEQVLHADGQLNRQYLRKLIFEDSDARNKLEQILHPAIRTEIAKRLSRLNTDYCILVIPLLVDIGEWDIVDRILVVDAPEVLQVERVMQRDQQTREAVVAILDTQVSREARLESADDIIDNTRDIKQLQEEVARLHRHYQDLARRELQGDPAAQIIYEQPLNERIRIFLRLEASFERVHYHAARNSKWDAQAVLSSLIEIANLTARGDLKSEIIKEIERQHASLRRLQHQAGIDQRQLTSVLDRQTQLLDQLHTLQQAINQHLNNEPLFSAVKQRINLPGGACDFDIPAYCHWTNLPENIRRRQYEAWLVPFTPVAAAISHCLETIRYSTDPLKRVAEKGFYQQSMQLQKETQLIRVITVMDPHYYPEISAGRHRFSVRFFNQQPQDARPQQCEQDIDFSLQLCSI